MYIVIDLEGKILGRFRHESEAHKFADAFKTFCYVEEL